MEQPIACVSACVPRAVIQFLTVKNTSAVEIHRQLIEVYGTDGEEVVLRVLRGAT